jgi:hypothetical protein
LIDEGAVADRVMIRQAAQRHLQRFRRRHIVRGATGPAIALAVMALVLVLMPVSYRAGTESAHPHTVFQVIVDQERGETHSHAGDLPASHASEAPTSSSALRLPLNVPLSTYTTLNDPGAAIEAMLRLHQTTHTFGIALPEVDPDLPQLTSVLGAPDLATALTLTSLLLVLFLLVQPLRRLWYSSAILRGIGHAIEGPPPRSSYPTA